MLVTHDMRIAIDVGIGSTMLKIGVTAIMRSAKKEVHLRISS